MSPTNKTSSAAVAADFGQRLREVRVEKGRTLRDVALNAKVSIAYLSDLERGKLSNPTLDKLRQIADELGVSVDDLLGSERAEEADESRLERSEALRALPRLPAFREAVQRQASGSNRSPRELTEDWLDALAAIQVDGRRPPATADYLFVFEAIRRALEDAP